MYSFYDILVVISKRSRRAHGVQGKLHESIVDSDHRLNFTRSTLARMATTVRSQLMKTTADRSESILVMWSVSTKDNQKASNRDHVGREAYSESDTDSRGEQVSIDCGEDHQRP